MYKRTTTTCMIYNFVVFYWNCCHCNLFVLCINILYLFCLSAGAHTRIISNKKCYQLPFNDNITSRSYMIDSTHLNTWFVQTMTECWLESWLSRTCSTKWIHKKSPVFCCNLVKTMQDLSCSDCVTVEI